LPDYLPARMRNEFVSRARPRRLASQAFEAGALETLLGLEGAAAHHYFSHLSGLLKVEEDAERPTFDVTARNRRPPRDPVNALLCLATACARGT